jgi:FkbM family methyltransferase
MKDRLELLKNNGFKPSSLLDIGGYLGIFSKLFKEVFLDVKITAIEPNKLCNPQLQNHVDILHNSLVSDEVKKVIYYKSKSNNQSGNSYHKEQTRHFFDCDKEELTTTTLDILLIGKTFDFIKIDTQGAELEVLNGGEGIIQGAEFVLIETKILEYNENSPSFFQIIDKMNKLGFIPFDFLELHYLQSRHLNEVDILFIKKDSPFLMRGILE